MLATRPNVTSRLKRRARVIAAAIAALYCLSMAMAPSSAHSASFAVWACADGAGHRQPATDWKQARVSSPLGYLLNSCGDSAAEPTARLLSQATMSPSNAPQSSGVGWSVDAVAGTRITGLDVWMVAVAFSTFALGRAEIYAPGTIYRLDQPSLDMGVRFGGPYASGPGSEVGAYSETNHQTYRGLSAPNVTLMAWCVAYCQGNEVSAGDSIAYLAAYRVKTTVDDATAPTGSATGLNDGARISATTAVQASARDVGGGVREISLRVDDRVVDRKGSDGDCADVDSSNSDSYEYNRMQPCPSQRAADLMLSPVELADGARHVVSVVATDAAGQDTVIASARVALAAPAGFFGITGFVNPDLNVIGPRALNGVNAGPGNAQLSFVARRGKRTRSVSRRVVGVGVRQRIAGRLTDAAGAPIAGARVWRFAATSKGLWQVSGAPLVTSKSGRVEGRLPSGHPSRDVRLVYFPYSDSSENTQSLSRRLAVRAATTIQLDQPRYRNGEAARFSGRITTRPVNAGQALYLQTIVRGHWRTFETTRADAKGRWKSRYRFTATRQLTSYRFRAVIPAGRGRVSWATGRSRSVRVLVSP
jgi:hypothetical protein